MESTTGIRGLIDAEEDYLLSATPEGGSGARTVTVTTLDI